MNLSDRMKQYERPTDLYLVKRMPAIIRVDGKAFHTFTKGFSPVYDEIFRKLMETTAARLCHDIQSARIAYSQSDEISILLIDYNKFNTDPFLNGRVQKIVSVVASMATLFFNNTIDRVLVAEKYKCNKDNCQLENPLVLLMATKLHTAMFDARVFNIPREDVTNYFIWRQQDAVRNSILSLGYKYFSHKDLLNLSCDQIQDKLFKEKGVNWNDCLVKLKRGFAATKVGLDLEIPEFTKNGTYIDRFVNQVEEGE